MQRLEMHYIQSLARGLKVLNAFTPQEPLLSLSDIAGKTGMNHSAAQRYTDTLMQLGYLKRNRRREFMLAAKVLSLGFTFLDGSALRTMARETIDAFGARLKRTVNMAVLEDTQVFFLHRYEAQRFLSHHLRPGYKLPAQVTSNGKVLLAALPDAQLKGLLKRINLQKVTSRTIASKKALLGDLMQTRERGYSLVDRELSLDLVQAGAPVLDQEGRVTAAVNISLPAEECAGKELDRSIEEIIGLGGELSAGLGWRGDYPLIRPAGPEGGAA